MKRSIEDFSAKKEESVVNEYIIDLDKDRFIDLIPILIEESYVSSDMEFEYLLEHGKIQLNCEVIDDIDYVLICNDILQIGDKKLKIIK